MNRETPHRSYLQFRLGMDRYVLDSEDIVEVVPPVEIKRLPRALTGVAGLVNYRGTAIPVIDLTALALGRPAELRLSTRIVVLRYPDRHGAPRQLAVVTENATAIIRKRPDEFAASGIDGGDAAWLGPVATDGAGIIQQVLPERLLPANIRDALFREAPEAS